MNFMSMPATTPLSILKMKREGVSVIWEVPLKMRTNIFMMTK